MNEAELEFLETEIAASRGLPKPLNADGPMAIAIIQARLSLAILRELRVLNTPVWRWLWRSRRVHRRLAFALDRVKHGEPV